MVKKDDGGGKSDVEGGGPRVKFNSNGLDPEVGY